MALFVEVKNWKYRMIFFLHIWGTELSIFLNLKVTSDSVIRSCIEVVREERKLSVVTTIYAFNLPCPPRNQAKTNLLIKSTPPLVFSLSNRNTKSREYTQVDTYFQRKAQSLLSMSPAQVFLQKTWAYSIHTRTSKIPRNILSFKIKFALAYP